MIRIKRAYEPAVAGDGKRFLVDRLWPRGAKKESLKLEGWIKELAPSNALRKWFGHDPEKWANFQTRYETELRESGRAWEDLLAAAKNGDITLVYGAKDTAHNNAAALKRFLDRQAARKSSATRTRN